MDVAGAVVVVIAVANQVVVALELLDETMAAIVVIDEMVANHVVVALELLDEILAAIVVIDEMDAKVVAALELLPLHLLSKKL